MTVAITENPESAQVQDITDPQARVLKFYVEFREQHLPPKSPTYDEVQNALSITRKAINMHLNGLRSRGLMTNTTNVYRGWRPTTIGEKYFKDFKGTQWAFSASQHCSRSHVSPEAQSA